VKSLVAFSAAATPVIAINRLRSMEMKTSSSERFLSASSGATGANAPDRRLRLWVSAQANS